MLPVPYHPCLSKPDCAFNLFSDYVYMLDCAINLLPAYYNMIVPTLFISAHLCMCCQPVCVVGLHQVALCLYRRLSSVSLPSIYTCMDEISVFALTYMHSYVSVMVSFASILSFLQVWISLNCLLLYADYHALLTSSPLCSQLFPTLGLDKLALTRSFFSFCLAPLKRQVLNTHLFTS